MRMGGGRTGPDKAMANLRMPSLAITRDEGDRANQWCMDMMAAHPIGLRLSDVCSGQSGHPAVNPA